MHDTTYLDWFDLTTRQRSIWLDLQTSGSVTNFQAGVYAEVRQAIDIERLRAAVRDVTERHDGLRLRIDARHPRQRIEPAIQAPVEAVDLSREKNPDKAALAFIRNLFTQPFSLDRSPLFQILILRTGAQRSYFVVRMHHIILDAIGLSHLLKDIAETYDTLETASGLARPASSYLPFRAEDAAYCDSPRFRRDIDYWKQRLADLPEALFAPRTDSFSADGRPGVVTLEADAGDYKRLLQHCAETKLRVGNTLSALVAMLLASVSGRRDIVLGVAVPGRGKDARSTIGLFSSVLPLRLDMEPTQSVPALVSAITESLGRDYLHYRAPIDDVCRAVGLVQKRRQNVFDVMISYMPLEVVDFHVEIGSEALRFIPIRGPDANPLAIYISEINEGRPFTLEFAFNHNYLTQEQAEGMAAEFGRILRAFVDDPSASLAAIVPALGARDTIAAVPANAPDRPTEKAHIRLLTGFTADPIVAPLKFWLGKLGLDAKVSLADYNQIFQELMDPTSPTRRNRQGANVVLVRIEDWLRERPVKIGHETDEAEDRRFLMQIASELAGALSKAIAASPVPHLVVICPPSPEWDAGGERAAAQQEALAHLHDRLASVGGVDLVTYAEWRDLYPVETEYDAAGDKLGHLPYTTAAFAAQATMAARRLHLLLRAPIKVIAADCDNTLWDGVVGEDGVEGIRLGEEHLALQRRLVEAAKSGVLICLVSKNIEADVLAVLERRPDMVLKAEHIVAHRINWKPKSDNLRSLAAELNLGLDSFVMLDDTPIEIGEIEANCPQALAIPCPPGTVRFDHLWPLDVRASTREDQKRVESYRQNAQRSKAREAAADFKGFIEGLGLKIAIEKPSDAELARLAQLTERTNQFNINGRKLTIADLNARRRTPGNAVFSVSVQDKFGDYGIVGLIAAHKDGLRLEVDTLLMSCRVLGRGVEHGMIAALGRAAGELGAATVDIPVRVTQRNLPVRQFLATLGGLREADDQAELHVLTQEAAAACAFNPETADLPDVPEDGAAPGILPERHVNGDGWVEIAGSLAGVDAVMEAARDTGAAERLAAPKAYREPETATEKALAELLCESMALDRIGADDDFFELGLHSLLAVQLVSRLRERLGIQIPVRSLFESSTVAKLAAEIDSDTRGSGYQPLVPLQVGNGLNPLFCCHPGNGDAVGYMRLANAMGPEQTVYGFEASGLAPGEPLATSVEEMARVYVKAMITAYPSGPYNLIGWSFGGGLAFEMARQIEEAGQEVGVLAFMDSVAPDLSGQHAEDFEMTDDLLLDGLTAQIRVLGGHFGVETTGSQVEQLTWSDVMENFQRFGVVPKGYTPEDMQRKMAVFSNCVVIFSRYRAGVIKAPILHFRALEKLGNWDYNWGPYTTAGIYNIRIKCNHFLMGFEPHVNKVARHLAKALNGEAPRTSWYVRGTGGLNGDASAESRLDGAA